MSNSCRNRSFGKNYVQPNVIKAKAYLKAKMIAALGDESQISALPPTQTAHSARPSRTYVITSLVDDSASPLMDSHGGDQTSSSPVVRTPTVFASRFRLRRQSSEVDLSAQPERPGSEDSSPRTPQTYQPMHEHHLRPAGESDAQVVRTWAHEAGETPVTGSFAERMGRRHVSTRNLGLAIDGVDSLDDPFFEHSGASADILNAPQVPSYPRNVPDSWSDDGASTSSAPEPAPARQQNPPPRTLVPPLLHEPSPRVAVQNIQSAMLDLTEALNDLVSDNRTHHHNARVLASSLAVRTTQVEQLRSRLEAAEAEVEMLRDLQRR
ncbi:hypothetical protein PV04_02981 [Phialophora macrospora]|uniref:Uncharacterized protein n=1 Tax=Phialophora macrospora TaxID=1851006 RepID=A0A0D2FW75_9EURO|nr:hypothetical protein PV04_02981 [Phialophora macrospora]